MRPLPETPPKLSFAALQKSVSGVVNALARLQGELLLGETLDAVASSVSPVLRLDADAIRPLKLSLEPWRGRELTPRTIFRIALRLNAHRAGLAEGRAAGQWFADEDCWTLLRVEAVTADPEKQDKLKVALLPLSGPPAGIELAQMMSDKFAYYLIKEIGYPAYQRAQSPHELVGCYFWAVLTADSRTHRTQVGNWSVPPSLRDRNRLLFRERDECYNNGGVLCKNCPLGRDKCRFAVKEHSWPVGDCPGGHRGHIHPSSTEGLCAKCFKRIMDNAKKKD